ncbi:MAG TPA: 16S rRNA (guanine(966)-N(2))-methyltransferase RsmD [Sumerlaeia bacterium]|nr:16S rRNA (guanine(966)-N(2))-methyltransferase RsmD [Sumerlaeia bacterium]
MIRVTGGEWKGQKLKTPAGRATRPTPARVRESLFDVLGAAVPGREFYDLYAGSGAAGLEALSRGASRAVFVDSSHAAVVCLRDNIRRLCCEARSQCVTQRLPGWLRLALFHPQVPVVIFVDPPYEESLAEKTLEVLGEVEMPWRGSLCAVQTGKKTALPESCGPWRLRKRYSHGDTGLWLFRAE